MNPDLNFLIGVTRGVLLSLRCTCHVSAFGFVDLIRFFAVEARAQSFTRSPARRPKLWRPGTFFSFVSIDLLSHPLRRSSAEHAAKKCTGSTFCLAFPMKEA